MLRRRIEKLERLLPLGTGDLMNRWERQAMSSLTSEDQALVRACFAKGSHCKKPGSESAVTAVACYEKALAESLREVSDVELDRMIESLGGAAIVAEVSA